MNNTFSHIPVLLEETVHSILPSPNLLSTLEKQEKNQIYIVDATLGGAGHAAYLIEKFHQNALYENFFLNVIGIDQDTAAIDAASQKLETLKKTYSRFRSFIYHANFAQLEEILSELDPAVKPRDDTLPLSSRGLTAGSSSLKIHGLYADFGVSSPQLDVQERGFSFLQEGPLDMRMNRENSLTAEKILLTYSETELARLFFEYAEEPKSRRLAHAIVTDRKASKLPLENTKNFAEYVKNILKYGYSRTHPATRIFQALRIEVNEELGSLQTLLNAVPNVMFAGAKAGFISFHSLEDRLVKKTMRLWQERGMGRENPRGGIIPTEKEITRNPRARSARLRMFDFVE